MPVIAAIDGYALGGGAELAYAADMRIGTPAPEDRQPRDRSRHHRGGRRDVAPARDRRRGAGRRAAAHRPDRSTPRRRSRGDSCRRCTRRTSCSPRPTRSPTASPRTTPSPRSTPSGALRAASVAASRDRARDCRRCCSRAPRSDAPHDRVPREGGRGDERARPACGVLGGGRMGAGIAHAFLLAGSRVFVVERDDGSADAAADRIRDESRRSQSSAAQRARPLAELERARSTTGTDVAAFAECDLVVEAVPEDRALKAACAARAERGDARCVRCSRRNTSSISIDDLGRRPAAPASASSACTSSTRCRRRRSSRSWSAPRPIRPSSRRARGWVDGARQDAGRRARLPRLRLEPARARARPRGDPDAGGGRRDGRRHRRGDGARIPASGRPAAHDRHRRASTCASASPRSCTRALGAALRTARAAAPDGRRGTARPQERRGLLRMERRRDDRASCPATSRAPGGRPDAAARCRPIVRDASTGEAVAAGQHRRASTSRAALEHARTVGQPSLGALTFHQRAVLLKQFALALTARKDELYALSSRTGATKADSLGRHRRRHRRAVLVLRQGRGASCRTRRCTSTGRSSPSRRTARSSAGTSTRACPASRCRSTPSTSRCGARSRSSRPRSSPACRRS